MTLYWPLSEYVKDQAWFHVCPLLEDVAMPIAPEMVFLSKKWRNDTVTVDKPVKLTGVVIMREAPETLGSLLNFNSLASPPALLVVEIDQLSTQLSVVFQPAGRDIESKVSLKSTDLLWAKIDAEMNNANVSSNVFFIIFVFRHTTVCLYRSFLVETYGRMSWFIALVFNKSLYGFSVYSIYLNEINSGV